MTDVHSLAEQENNHTPGPWASFYKHKYDEWHVGVPMTSGSMKLALFPNGIPTDNPEADCNLIAAAPDLLAACKAQHDIIDRLMVMVILKDPAFRPTKSVAWPVILQGNAAIAKAEGTST